MLYVASFDDLVKYLFFLLQTQGLLNVKTPHRNYTALLAPSNLTSFFLGGVLVINHIKTITGSFYKAMKAIISLENEYFSALSKSEIGNIFVLLEF